MNLLIVEDEPKLGDYLCKGLRECGFSVDLARDGAAGLAAARDTPHDAVVLDVMLPRKDGFEVLRELRSFSKVPVLMLTARDGVEDRVRGLEGGADDYLAKPFAFTELVARVRALLRRSPMQEVVRYELADLQLDMVARRVSRGGRRVDLTAKEFTLLALLLRRQGQVLARSVLADQVWGMNFDTETNMVDVAVRRLRSKIDDPFALKLLHTVRGMGYVLEQR